MRVAAQSPEGDVHGITQTELAERAQIARSTLSTYLDAHSDAVANPKLDAICSLGETLGIPPGFLLMQTKDWASLASAVLTFLRALQSPEFRAAIERLQDIESTTSPVVAEAAIELGRLLNTVENDQDSRLGVEIRDFRRATKSSTAAIAASIPFNPGGVSKDHLPILLTLCGIIGTTTVRT
jgi:transcriptional regulator with XRE-family HTH domain